MITTVVHARFSPTKKEAIEPGQTIMSSTRFNQATQMLLNTMPTLYKLPHDVVLRRIGTFFNSIQNFVPTGIELGT
jgi:hypothetical protein